MGRKSAAVKQEPSGGETWGTGLWAVAVLFVVYLFAYQPVFGAGFIWDDDSYLQENMTLRTADGLRRMWFEFGAIPQYYPLVHSTFWLEFQTWQLDPVGYHVVNILLHATGACLLWRLLRRLAVPGAGLAAALFLLHPVQVESVAWITERKNVLSMVCALIAWHAWLRFRPSSDASAGRPLWWVVAFVAFIAALLSKTVTASLPAVLLVVAWWKDGRIAWRDVRALLPWFVVGVALGLNTARIEMYDLSGTGKGAVGEEWDLSLYERGLLAGRVAWFYVAKLAWPNPLTFIYPRWTVDGGVFAQALFPLTWLFVLVALWWKRQEWGRGPLAGALLFLGILFPALGFFNVWPFQFSYVADHFQYHATPAIFVLFAAGLVRLVSRLPASRKGAVRYGVPAVVLAMCTGITWNHGHDFRDLETLWRDTIEESPECWMAHNNLGQWLMTTATRQPAGSPMRVAQLAESERLLRRAIELKDPYPGAWLGLANTLAEQGRMAEAHAIAERLVVDNPEEVQARVNRATWIAREGDIPRAVELCREALEIEPRHRTARINLSMGLQQLGQFDEAQALLEEGFTLRPDDAILRFVYGNLHLQREAQAQRARDPEALRAARRAAESAFREALALDANHAPSRQALQQLVRRARR